MPIFFSDEDFRKLAAACDRVLPHDEALGAPGASAAHVAAYIDALLGAFSFDPPHIWAGGPFSGRRGGEAGFGAFIPLGALDELAWRIRIEGSLGIPEREFNGPVTGWQELYTDGLARLGTDFALLDPADQDARLEDDPPFKALLYGHACEGMYGDPVYGGNHDGVGWTFIAFEGDAQPRGYTADEVAAPRGDR